jgi:hypothetical protein
MLAIGFFLGGGLALVLMLWLIRELAIYAMPFWIGLMAFLGIYHHQAGIFAPLLGGVIAAGLVFGAWRVLLHFTASPALRAVVALSFAAPPTVIAYLGALQIARLGIASALVCQVVAIAAALYIAVQSWQRIAGRESPSPLPQHHPA